MKPTTVRFALLVLDDACQVRASARLDDDHVAALAAAYAAGDAVPPIACVEMADGELVVVDGYHRWAALAAVAKRAKKAPILGAVPVVVVAKGDRSTASYHALAANASHGIRRTSADKRHAIRLALAHPQCQRMSQAMIAQHLGVSVDLVAEERRALLGATSPKAEAPTKAVDAVTAEAAAVAAGAEPRSVRAIAEAAGVSRTAVESAAGRITGIRDKATQNPNDSAESVGPDASLHVAGLEALAALERATRPLRVALSVADRQAWEGHAAKMRWLIESARPERCPSAEHDDRCCRGTMIVRADEARRIAR